MARCSAFSRRARAASQGQVSIFDAYFDGPSLWLGVRPSRLSDEPRHLITVRALHKHLRLLTLKDPDVDGATRRVVFQALRRALLRESVLLRILPDRSELAEAQWGELLFQQFFAALPGQTEGMADRIAVFVEDMLAAAGSFFEPNSPRHTMFEATKLKDQQFVALVTGSKDTVTRERVFAGFNSPLLPEVLVCTSVGQEGIDLRRHCRHVVHYDLAWNPAVLEQRTGRTDRIGSKTFRERKHMSAVDGPFLEVGVPFLAGTYDERMYEELRLRAQTFEVLTGGDLAPENAEGEEHEGALAGRASKLVPLPDQMLTQMRVNLHVWRDTPDDLH